MLDAGVQALRILADDYQVHARIARRNSRQVVDRTKIAEQLKLFPQRDVDRRESAADGRGDRALEADLRPLQRFGELVRDVLMELFVSLGAGGEAFPIELHARGF